MNDSTPQHGDIELRISVARIEGMLNGTLARHDQRLDQHDTTLTQHDDRLNEKGKMLARHDERLLDLEEDSSSRWSRVLGVLALTVSGVGVFYTLLAP